MEQESNNKRKVGENEEVPAKKIKEEKDLDIENSLLDTSEEDLISEDDGEVEFLEVVQPKKKAATNESTNMSTAKSTAITDAKIEAKTDAKTAVKADARSTAIAANVANDYKSNPKCKDCGEYFISRHRLLIHMEKKHGVASKDDKKDASKGNVATSTPKEPTESGRRQKKTPRRYFYLHLYVYF